MKTKQTKKNVLSHMHTFLIGSRGLFAAAIVCALVAAFADMLAPQILRFAVDRVLLGDSSGMSPFLSSVTDALGGLSYLAAHLWVLSVLLLTVSLVRVAAQYGFRVLNTKASETLVKNMRDMTYEKLQRLPFSFHMKNRTGDMIQRATSDIDMVKNFVSEQLTSIFRIIIMLVLSVIFMFSMHAKLSFIAMIPLPVILAYSLLFHRMIGDKFRVCDESEGRLSAMVQENLTGTRVVRAFGREAYERERFEAHNETYTGLWRHLAKVMACYWSTADILSGVQVMLVLVFGAVFCVGGSMTAGEYIAFLTYNSMLVWPIRQLGRMISELSKAGVSVERLAYITDAEEEHDLPDVTDADMTGDIVFSHVTFGYDGCPELLHDVSFTVRSGTTLGILGTTGSGKSTLMLLLDKLYPLPEGGGQITVGGVDVSRIRTAHLRKNIGIVLQEPFLFSETLENNIGIAAEHPSEEDIREAAHIACLDETVEKFRDGWQTFVGERGVTLSGGQKQRVAIARMLMQKTPVMIFDDSLSAVDTETDAKIRHALEEHFGRATVILISHRITTLSRADKIIVLDRGRIAEEGTHAELCHAGGIYQKICEAQTYTTGEEDMPHAE